MLLSEIIYNIKNLKAGGTQSDDEGISDRQYAHIINYYRAKLIKQDQDRGRYNNALYQQDLGKLDLIVADQNDCCDVDKCVLRTKLQVPKPLETQQDLNITFVGLINGTPFQRFYFNATYWAGANKYTGKDPKWYYQNGYIYIVNAPTNMLSYISIKGVFEDPKKAKEFRTCDCPQNNQNCNRGFDFEYPLPAHYEDVIVKLITESEIRLSTLLPEDELNDGTTKPSRNA